MCKLRRLNNLDGIQIEILIKHGYSWKKDSILLCIVFSKIFQKMLSKLIGL